jgi:hypothetical protein
MVSDDDYGCGGSGVLCVWWSGLCVWCGVLCVWWRGDDGMMTDDDDGWCEMYGFGPYVMTYFL